MLICVPTPVHADLPGSGFEAGVDFLAFLPERINPGDGGAAVRSILQDRGGHDELSTSLMALLYGALVKPTATALPGA